MIDKVKRGQEIYYYRNIFDAVEKGTVEDPTIITDSCRPVPEHPIELKLIKNVHWDEYVYKDGTTARSLGNSTTLIDNVFLTAKEAYEHQDAMIEKLKKELRGEITCLEDLLRYPLNHCLHGEDFDENTARVYEERCQKVLSGELDLCIHSVNGNNKGQNENNLLVWSMIKRK